MADGRWLWSVRIDKTQPEWDVRDCGRLQGFAMGLDALRQGRWRQGGLRGADELVLGRRSYLTAAYLQHALLYAGEVWLLLGQQLKSVPSCCRPRDGFRGRTLKLFPVSGFCCGVPNTFGGALRLLRTASGLVDSMARTHRRIPALLRLRTVFGNLSDQWENRK